MIATAVGAAVLFALLAALFSYRGKAVVHLPVASCDAGLWDHVYEKDRLALVEPCTAIEGQVVSIRQEAADGDAEVQIVPDRRSAMNLLNLIHNKGRLIVEIVCDHPPRKPEAQPACANFRSHVSMPRPGDRVRVTGAYVTDRDWGWREIHPVTRMEILQ